MTMRNCRDRSGTEWEVFEVLPPADARSTARMREPYRSGWLCFQSKTERCRIAPIPPGWARWDEDSLSAALEHGLRYPRRTPQSVPIQAAMVYAPLPDGLLERRGASR
jgi:hypothetical protein